MTAFSQDDETDVETSMSMDSTDQSMDDIIASLKESTLKRKKPQLRIEVIDLDPSELR